MKYNDIQTEIAKLLESDEHILWQGTNEKTTYFNTIKPQEIIKDLFFIILGIFTLVLVINSFSAFDSYVITLFLCIFSISFPIFGIKTSHPALFNKFFYVITDRNVYFIRQVKSKSKSANSKYEIAYRKISAQEIFHIHIEVNKDGTATLMLSRPESSYTGLNYRTPYDHYKNQKAREKRKDPTPKFPPLFNVKDHEAACKYITMLMNSAK